MNKEERFYSAIDFLENNYATSLTKLIVKKEAKDGRGSFTRALEKHKFSGSGGSNAVFHNDGKSASRMLAIARKKGETKNLEKIAGSMKMHMGSRATYLSERRKPKGKSLSERLSDFKEKKAKDNYNSPKAKSSRVNEAFKNFMPK